MPEGGYVASVEELPGALTQDETLDEARANLDDAVRLMINTYRGMCADDAGEVIRERLLITE